MRCKQCFDSCIHCVMIKSDLIHPTPQLFIILCGEIFKVLSSPYINICISLSTVSFLFSSVLIFYFFTFHCFLVINYWLCVRCRVSKQIFSSFIIWNRMHKRKVCWYRWILHLTYMISHTIHIVSNGIAVFYLCNHQ